MIKLLSSYCPELLAIEVSSHVTPWSESTLRSCFQSGYSAFGIIDDDSGVLQGFYIAHAVCDELTLMNIAVHPDFQGRGLGRQLLQHLLETAKSSSATVWLEVRASNSVAIALYVALGFSEVGRRPNYYPTETGREDALVMRWA